MYLDAFDHFAKEALRLPSYLRYADDVVVLDRDPVVLHAVIPRIADWLWHERRMRLHPRKLTIRKLAWGIDFLGYVTLPYYRVLRTKTKRRMFERVRIGSIASYLGVLRHCAGAGLRRRVVSEAARRGEKKLYQA